MSRIMSGIMVHEHRKALDFISQLMLIDVKHYKTDFYNNDGFMDFLVRENPKILISKERFEKFWSDFARGIERRFYFLTSAYDSCDEFSKKLIETFSDVSLFRANLFIENGEYVPLIIEGGTFDDLMFISRDLGNYERIWRYHEKERWTLLHENMKLIKTEYHLINNPELFELKKLKKSKKFKKLKI